MFRRIIAVAAAMSMAATPCLAADLGQSHEAGERRSGASAGAYLSIPFSGKRGGRTQAGLRLQMTHDYRSSAAQAAPVIRADALDLRLVGDKKTTFYVAGRPVTGDEARERNLTGGIGSLVTLAIIVAAVVGGIVIYRAIDDSGEE